MISATELPHQADTVQQKPLAKKNNSTIWKVIFITLFIIDAVFYWIITRGIGFGFIKIIFLLLPIVNLIFCMGLFIKNDFRIVLFNISYAVLIIVNTILGYDMYDQERYGIGAGFLAFIPPIFVLASNDLMAILFYASMQNLQGIAKTIFYIIFYIVLSIISIILLWSFIISLPMFPYILSHI